MEFYAFGAVFLVFFYSFQLQHSTNFCYFRIWNIFIVETIPFQIIGLVLSIEFLFSPAFSVDIIRQFTFLTGIDFVQAIYFLKKFEICILITACLLFQEMVALCHFYRQNELCSISVTDSFTTLDFFCFDMNIHLIQIECAFVCQYSELITCHLDEFPCNYVDHHIFWLWICFFLEIFVAVV